MQERDEMHLHKLRLIVMYLLLMENSHLNIFFTLGQHIVCAQLFTAKNGTRFELGIKTMIFVLP